MSGTVVDDILAYECTVGTQKAGSLSATALAAIASLAPRPLLLSVETGCGKSTVLLLHLGRYCLVSARRYGSQSHVHPALSFVPSGARWALPTDVMESNKYGNGIYAFEMNTVNASFGW